MTPFWEDDHLTLFGGDCRTVLASMPAESVHCVVTSPPYFGLRDYGTSGQLGLEDTVGEYVANMVAVFREVRRVLRSDGTLWLNLGDSYAGSWGAQSRGNFPSDKSTLTTNNGRGPKAGDKYSALSSTQIAAAPKDTHTGTLRDVGVKPKDLYGVPWRVAFALQADGWYLRSDIIWAKPNPMPESVTDRPTKAHEYLFLLSKAPRYFFDSEAVRRPVSPNWQPGKGAPMPELGDHRAVDGARGHQAKRTYDEAKGANIRTVWEIATEPYPGAHFATFPRKLVEPCVKAGTSERGVCPECGAPWERVVERKSLIPWEERKDAGAKPGNFVARPNVGEKSQRAVHGEGMSHTYGVTSETTGWRPSCDHETTPVPAQVLDPFAGSGTTLLVAQSLGRRGVGIDLNPDYLKQALTRNAQTPLGLVG